MFKAVRYDAGKLVDVALAVSQTVVKGDALQWASGYLQVGTTGSTDIRFVAMEDVTTTAATHTTCLVLPVEGVEFEVATDDVVSIADLGTYAQLATKATIDPDDSTADAFYIRAMIGIAETSKKVVGHFVHALE